MQWVEELREFPPFKRFHLFGIVGSVVVTACSIVAGVGYSGASREGYSPLNHFISELGQVGVSRLAVVFNAGLVAAGVLYVPFALGLGTMLGGWWAAAGTVAALVAAASVACVGFFPMNNLQPHIAAATAFFRSGLVTMLLFGIALQRQRPERTVIDRRANIAGLAAFLAYAVFLVWLWPKPGTPSGLGTTGLANRPAIWTGAILEWAVMVATTAWFLVVGLCRRSRRPDRRGRTRGWCRVSREGRRPGAAGYGAGRGSRSPRPRSGGRCRS